MAISPDILDTLPPPASDPFAPLTDDKSGLDAMRSVQREKLGAETNLFGEQEATLAADRATMKKAMESAGVEAGKLQPWNAQENEDKFFSSPIEAFGSLGSVFGVIASAFTRAPLENALNASAGAMNAIRGGEEKQYEHAYETWKENMKLVEQRQKIQQEQFKDAADLMGVDMAAGQFKARNLAARFGDQQSLALLDAGMSKEWFELQDARTKAHEGLQRAMQDDIIGSAKKTMLNGDPDWNTQEQNPAMKAALKLRAFNRYYGKTPTAEQEAIGQLLFENPKATPDDLADLHQKFSTTKKKTGKPMSAEAAFANLFFKNHPDAGEDEFIAEYAKFKAAQKSGKPEGVLTPGRQESQAIEEQAQRMIIEAAVNGETLPHDEAFVRAKREIQAATRVPSGNKIDTLQALVNKTHYFEEAEQKVEKLLTEHNALTGLGGKILRPAESVGNVLGFGSTAFHQFDRDVAELQDWWTQINRESTTGGRALSVTEQRVGKIIAGTNWGDTTKNTIEAYRELMPLIREMREDFIARGKGAVTGPKPAPAAPNSDKPWMRDAR